jgi:twitching motility protein PilT
LSPVSSKKVLVVHDDANYAEEVRRGLAQAGLDMQVISALSGPRAIGMMSTITPDIVIADGELLGMDGYTLTQQLKADASTSAVPVVIVSLQPTESSALKARQCGASAHLASAGSIDALISKVASLTDAQPAPPVAQVPEASPAPSCAPADTTYAAQPAPAAVASGADSLSDLEAKIPSVYGDARQTPPAGGQTDPASAWAPAPTRAHYMGVPDIVVEDAGPSAAGEIPHIDDLLRIMLDRSGSDLHITVGSPPGIRQRGELVPLENCPPLTPRDTMEMILNLLSEEQRRRFETELELDWAYSIPGVSRFRANVFQQRNSMGAVFRVIPIDIPTIEELGLPKVCNFLADRPRGMVLVTGPTGSGKSTTLAAMIDRINETRPLHIVTLEDPIEFMHRNKRAYVNQREVGEDTHSFSAALKRVLRQDPDVILVGEMRDLETIQAAITAAETGHLVLATLHTTGGPATVDRIIDVFPPHQQQQVRMQLSTTLEGVLSQTLLRSTDGRTRVMAMEVMLGTPAIQNLIREGKTHQMPTIIQGGAALGMQTLDQDLKRLLQSAQVTFEEAIGKAQNPRELAQMVGRRL